MGEAPVDLAARSNGNAFIGDVARNARACFDNEFTHGNRALDMPGEASGLRHDAPLYTAVRALNERSAGDIAFHLTIDMQISGGVNIAPHRYIGAEDREGGLA